MKKKFDDAIAYGLFAWSPLLNLNVDNDKESNLLEEYKKFARFIESKLMDERNLSTAKGAH